MAKEMIKRKDGSVSQRGLWDNIRANKGSGKKPTAAMLKQEKKLSKMGNGGKIIKNFSKPVSDGADMMRYGGKAKSKK